MNGANQAVSGGIGGFLAFFLLACALWLLMRNMNKRLRNIKYDEELEQQRHVVEATQETVTRPRRRRPAQPPKPPLAGGAPSPERTAASAGPDDATGGPADPDPGPLRRASAGH